MPPSLDIINDLVAAIGETIPSQGSTLTRSKAQDLVEEMLGMIEADKNARKKTIRNVEKVALAKANTILQKFSLDTRSERAFAVCTEKGQSIKAGKEADVFYERSSGPFRGKGDEIYLHYAFNRWTLNGKDDGTSGSFPPVKMRPLELPASVTEKEWFVTTIPIDQNAFSLEFVFSEMSQGGIYDNNDTKDFSVAVAGAKYTEESWYVELERVKSEVEARKRRQQTGKLGEIMLADRVEKQKKTWEILAGGCKAGGVSTVIYRPAGTHIMNDHKANPHLVYGFNRWQKEGSALKMTQTSRYANWPEELVFFVDIKIPKDAYRLDFVFSDAGEGAQRWDSNHGKDYFVSVSDSSTEVETLHITHIAVEMAPIAKVGGLADVIHAISKASEAKGNFTEVILPKFDCLDYRMVESMKEAPGFWHDNASCRIFEGFVDGVRTIFIDIESDLFRRGTIYGSRDDAHRFQKFSSAAMQWLINRRHGNGTQPDIIHCHDWSTAPVAKLYWDSAHHAGLDNPKVIFTIHNLNFGDAQVGEAMVYANKATTVSPSYAKEISCHPAVKSHLGKFSGIRNGIDYTFWDPMNDMHIPKDLHYSFETAPLLKPRVKLELQNRLNLDHAEVPAVCVITRLTDQKGVSLIERAVYRTLERGGQFILLGSAPDPKVQSHFESLGGKLESQNRGRCRFVLCYDEPLSHMIYAGADMIVVPSMFEPCGLTQLIAMRYGTIPVVRKTGGLSDTVFDLDHDKERCAEWGPPNGPNGFNFEGTDNGSLDNALDRAMDTWYNSRENGFWYKEFVPRLMSQDWTWNEPAEEYLNLYWKTRLNR